MTLLSGDQVVGILKLSNEVTEYWNLIPAN